MRAPTPRRPLRAPLSPLQARGGGEAPARSKHQTHPSTACSTAPPGKNNAQPPGDGAGARQARATRKHRGNTRPGTGAGKSGQTGGEPKRRVQGKQEGAAPAGSRGAAAVGLGGSLAARLPGRLGGALLATVLPPSDAGTQASPNGDSTRRRKLPRSVCVSYRRSAR